MSLRKDDIAPRTCKDPICAQLFSPTQAIQKYCSDVCRRRMEHQRYLARYPDEGKRRMEKLLAWKKEHPDARRVRREHRKFDRKIKYPTWLAPR